MAGAESVARGFRSFLESGETICCSKRLKAIGPTGQQFVCIALVGDVEKEFVLWRGEYAQKSDGQLDDAEIGSEMPALFRNSLQDFGP